MERRVLIAVILSFLVLYGYQALFVPSPTGQRQVPPTASSPSSPNSTATPPAGVVQPAAQAMPTSPVPEAVISEPAERLIVVETATVQAKFSNRGGRVVEWKLKQYRDNSNQLLDLVPSGVPVDQPRPFSLQVDDPQLTQRLNTSLYRVSGDSSGRVDATAGPATLVFEYQDAAGLIVRKTFRFDPQTFVVTVSAAVSSSGRTLNPAIAWGPGLGDVVATSGGGGFFNRSYDQPAEAIYHLNGKAVRVAATKIGEQPVFEGPFRFAGIDDHYFLAVLVNPGQARVRYATVSLPAPNSTQRQLLAATYTFPQAPKDIRFFFGPKQFDLLRSVDSELVRAINFGMFAFLAVPLLSALKWIHGYVGNYGLSIIGLTILINLVIFPLRHKSVVSMRKMQLLQPQLKLIQDRYAGLKVTDPARQKMNTEIMNLYRERGVNPASGCVPMLLTMPVLFAFYSLLSQAVELRGADFGLWIHDLSFHDPLYITPVLMGASMFWQQRITPSTADPAQQKVMMVMPLMFSFMFLWAPAGLVIYWFVSNLWAIGQQYFTNYWLGPAPLAGIKPSADRRLKSAGAGKSAGAEKGN